jgi:hypothetical protein
MEELAPLSDELRATLHPVVAAYITRLEAALAAVGGVLSALQKQVRGLQARVAELEARLGQNPANSSRPPPLLAVPVR